MVGIRENEIGAQRDRSRPRCRRRRWSGRLRSARPGSGCTKRPICSKRIMKSTQSCGSGGGAPSTTVVLSCFRQPVTAANLFGHLARAPRPPASSRFRFPRGRVRWRNVPRRCALRGNRRAPSQSTPPRSPRNPPVTMIWVEDTAPVQARRQGEGHRQAVRHADDDVPHRRTGGEMAFEMRESAACAEVRRRFNCRDKCCRPKASPAAVHDRNRSHR